MPIHIAITRRVRPGCEAEFQQALREFFQTSFAHGCVLGATMIVPPPGSDSREFGILRTFADEKERDAFYASPIFKAWVGLLCIAAQEENGGILPAVEDVAHHLGAKVQAVEALYAQLEDRRLLDRVGEIVHLHNWESRQPRSDNATERMANIRRTNSEHVQNKGRTLAEHVRPRLDKTREEQNRAEEKRAEQSARAPLLLLFENCFARPLSPMEHEQIVALEEEHPYERIEYAVREASASNHRSVRYIQRVCERVASGASGGEPDAAANTNGVAGGVSDVDGRIAALAEQRRIRRP